MTPPGDARPLACVLGDMDLLRPLCLAGIPCATVAAPDDAVHHSRFARVRVERPGPGAGPAALIALLAAFGERRTAPPVLFYESDEDLAAISAHRDELRRTLRFRMPAPPVVTTLLDKARFQVAAERLGLPVPPACRIRPGGDAAHGLGVGFPVAVKPLNHTHPAWARVAGPRKALRIDGEPALAALLRGLDGTGADLLAQELVPGPESRVESYHVYVGGDGAILGEFTGRKIRTSPSEHGYSTALETTDAHDVTALGRDVVDRFGVCGVAKVDFKRTPAGDLRLLEVNPRFNLWHNLGAVAGVNLPAIAYADLAGERPAPRTTARAGCTWSLPWRDFAVARQAGVPLGTWARGTVRADAISVVAWDDPMPFLRGRVWLRVRRAAARALARGREA